VLFIRSLCSLSTTVYAVADSVVDQVALLPSNNGLRHSEQYLLYIRSLCSLPILIVCTVVSQIALLPSYNSKATGSLQNNFILDSTEFIWILLKFIEFLSEKRGHVKSWTMCQRHHSHMRRSIYTRQGFHLGLWPFLNPLLIKFVLKSVCYTPFLQHSV